MVVGISNFGIEQGKDRIEDFEIRNTYWND